jgi:voltage-gated potassium channel
MHNQTLFLILRRMRAPLLVLIATYTIAVGGLVLMPGVDPQGNPHHISFFHAFYVITYTATTTGFGELPHPFTDAQRLWVTLTMYLSIVSWLYAIGTLIALVREPTFKRVFIESRFAAAVRRINQPFYIVCGYGDAGAVVAQAITKRIFAAVVLESHAEHIDAHTLEQEDAPILTLVADARLPANLLLAGLYHRHCAGVIALCDSDATNLQIAISAKLLNPRAFVICRAESHDTQANMESFDTDLVINPFDSFAERLAMALHSPDVHHLHQWLTSMPGTPLSRRIDPPHGTWVLCGYGRFGKALAHYLHEEGIKTVIIEATPEQVQAPKDCIVGRGTEDATLQEAGIENAVGIVAGTDNDANNLSIIVTARALNPKLFTVARQNRRENDAIFQAAKTDLVMQRSRALARRIVASVSTPLLASFLHYARSQNNDWARALLARLRPAVRDRVPEVWTIDITDAGAQAVQTALREGEEVRLDHLLRDPRDRSARLTMVILLLRRGSVNTMLPADDTRLAQGDRLLLCGSPDAARSLNWVLFNSQVLYYLRHGEERPDSAIWRWWRQARSE